MSQLSPRHRTIVRRGAAAFASLTVATALGAGAVSGPAHADDVVPATAAPSTLGFSSVSTTTAPSGGGAATTAAPTTKAAGGTTASSAAGAATDHLAAGRAAIDAANWKLAVTELTMAVAADPKSADANNLLGFSYRKSGNLTKAFQFYAVALKINPKHIGALEYQGEAFVEAGQLPKAKANLAKLATICGKTCEQYVDLAEFIAKAPAKKK